MREIANKSKDIIYSLNKKALKYFFGVKNISFYSSLIVGDTIKLFAKANKRFVICPCCKQRSSHVHSYYERKLSDLPISGKRVIISFKARKFRCENPNCSRKIFSEQATPFTLKYCRRTNRLTAYLQKILIEMSARKGSLITGYLGVKQSSSSCLRIVSQIPIPDQKYLHVVGIDDWAKRKGLNYGTIIVNAQTNRPIDLLDSRDSKDIVLWLSKHPEIQYVTRDRASGYAGAINKSIPNAAQIADKFHILKNFGDYIAEEIRNQYPTIKKQFMSTQEVTTKTDSETSFSTISQIVDTELLERAKSIHVSPRSETLFKEVQRLKSKGFSQRKIAKIIHANKWTVKKYWHLTAPQPRLSNGINNYHVFLCNIIEGCHRGINMRNIYKEIVSLGFNGKLTAFYVWFHKVFPDYSYKRTRNVIEQKLIGNVATIRMKLISPNRLAIHVANPRWGLSKQTGKCNESHILAEEILKSSSVLKELRTAYVSFRQVINGSSILDLEDWLKSNNNTKLKSLKSFVNGINHDINAVKNAILYNWTNGLIEGEVNRLKSKKREMYGRAGFQLLRRKVVLAVSG